MGSTQKPLDRPQVVSTIWSSWRARTKQSPRCPSSSLQNRGQTSHWMRPLSSACQYFVGTVSPVMGASLLMLPMETDGRGVGIPLTPRRPPVFRYCPLKRPYCPPEWRHRPPVFHRGPAKSPSCPLPGRHRPPVVRAAPPPFLPCPPEEGMRPLVPRLCPLEARHRDPVGAHGPPLGSSEKREGADGEPPGKAREARGHDRDPEGAGARSHGRGKFRVGGMGASGGKDRLLPRLLLRRRQRLQLVERPHRPSPHHVAHLAQVGDVGRGVGAHDQEVGELALLDGA